MLLWGLTTWQRPTGGALRPWVRWPLWGPQVAHYFQGNRKLLNWAPSRGNLKAVVSRPGFLGLSMWYLWGGSWVEEVMLCIRTFQRPWSLLVWSSKHPLSSWLGPHETTWSISRHWQMSSDEEGWGKINPAGEPLDLDWHLQFANEETCSLTHSGHCWATNELGHRVSGIVQFLSYGMPFALKKISPEQEQPGTWGISQNRPTGLPCPIGGRFTWIFALLIIDSYGSFLVGIYFY